MVKRKNRQQRESKLLAQIALSSSIEEKIMPAKRIRKLLGMTQVEFGLFLGIDPTTVSRCERGLTELNLSLLQGKKLSVALGIEIQEVPDTFAGVDIDV